MRSRSDMCYPKAVSTTRKADLAAGDCLKRARLSPEMVAGGCGSFDALPDDLVLSVLSKLSSTANCPADFISVLMACKRLNRLGLNSVVLSIASFEIVAVDINRWSEYYHRFLKLCGDTGNPIVYAYYSAVQIFMKELQFQEEKGQRFDKEEKERMFALICIVWAEELKSAMIKMKAGA